MKITVQFNKEYCEKNLRDTEDTCVEIENAETFRNVPNSDGVPNGKIVEITGTDLKIYTKPLASSKARNPLKDEKTNKLRYCTRYTENIEIGADEKDLKTIEELRENDAIVGNVVEIQRLTNAVGGTLTHVGYVYRNDKDKISLMFEKDDFWNVFRNYRRKIKWDSVVRIEVLR